MTRQCPIFSHNHHKDERFYGEGFDYVPGPDDAYPWFGKNCIYYQYVLIGLTGRLFNSTLLYKIRHWFLLQNKKVIRKLSHCYFEHFGLSTFGCFTHINFSNFKLKKRGYLGKRIYSILVQTQSHVSLCIPNIRILHVDVSKSRFHTFSEQVR